MPAYLKRACARCTKQYLKKHGESAALLEDPSWVSTKADKGGTFALLMCWLGALLLTVGDAMHTERCVGGVTLQSLRR